MLGGQSHGERGVTNSHLKHIDLSIRSQDGRSVSFRVKRTAELGKLKELYCGKHAIDLKSTVVFLYEDHRVNNRDTPDQLNMDDGDQLDVMIHQIGVSPSSI